MFEMDQEDEEKKNQPGGEREGPTSGQGREREAPVLVQNAPVTSFTTPLLL